MRPNFFCGFCFVFLLTLTAACSSDKDETQKTEPLNVLYDRATDSMNNRNFKKAADEFQEVERQYPYSEWAKRALLMAAFSDYRAGQFDDAIGLLERYVKFYPSSDSAAYAYYLRALCHYEQIVDVGRDQKTTQAALDALTEVIKRFPESQYARDAKLKRDLTIDHLAGKEMEIGRYYLVRHEYLSAINRFKYVLDNYQTTGHTPEALHRMVECYLSLGVHDEAQKYGAVLGHNFPGSRWYMDSYALLNGKAPAESEKKGVLKKMLDVF